MINHIIINNVATYNSEVKIIPSKINYFFGSNGSGKTTLSRIINNPDKYGKDKCSVSFYNGSNMSKFVYNSDFIRENFVESDSIKGIFTLGKESKNIIEDINKLKVEILKIENKIMGYNKTLSDKRKTFEENKNKLTNNCWKLKLKYESIFGEAFNGFKSSKSKFLNNCLSQVDNNCNLLDKEELINKYNSLFVDKLVKYENIEMINYDKLKDFEEDKILSLKIIGKHDVEIGDLINSLNNSDWVKQGLKFLDNSKGICPFCQQELLSDLKSKIDDFFDETYSKKISYLETFRNNYNAYVTNLLDNLYKIQNCNINIIKTEDLKEKLLLIESKFKSNKNLIDEKIKSPSICITLDSLISDFDEISLILKNYISKIEENNRLLENISIEKEIVINQVWKYIYSQEEHNILKYIKEEKEFLKIDKNIKNKINLGDINISKIKLMIQQKQTDIINISDSIKEINKILKSFGFDNFMISESKEKGFYKIVRPNTKEDAKTTLSEGEYTLITFLYFYQLINGSTSKNDITNSRIVVIDDPISSLDSSILFIISTLIKDIISNCNSPESSVKQVFVLTHNIYFYKEVTFKPIKDKKNNSESFWIIRKKDNNSTITKYTEDPVKTTYELLWSEIINRDKINNVTIFNTLRRILEYYFNILGSMNYEKLINSFDGKDKLIFKSLVSWINDGSHFIADDLEIPITADDIDRYLSVFTMIFDKAGHKSHYDMMIDRVGNRLSDNNLNFNQLEVLQKI